MDIKILSVGDLLYRYTGSKSKFNNQDTAIILKPILIEFQLRKSWEMSSLYIMVPENFVTDFGTIPRVLQWLVKPRGTSDRAFVVHDWLCVSKCIDQCIADLLLKELMIHDGTSKFESTCAYIGVRFFDIFIRPLRNLTNHEPKLLGNNKELVRKLT